MINEVVLEGIVVREPWKYMEDLFFRVVIYRDHDLPVKKLDQEHDAGDYINVRLNGAANGLIQIRKGMRLRIHGFLQSRDYKESLENFLGKARRSGNRLEEEGMIQAGDPRIAQVLVDRNLVETVARRIIVLDGRSPVEKRFLQGAKNLPGGELASPSGGKEGLSPLIASQLKADPLM
ncbi:MAG: hypothetical protein NTZ74_14560 [Chloroflexi bacterium]|nr:hypothetical protein [Chloroflexota bacterium]